MKTITAIIVTMLLLVLAQERLEAQGRTATTLNGAWTFGLDPLGVGEVRAWYNLETAYTRFDKVTVPHSFSVDPRYSMYTGKAWYFRKFSSPAASADKLSVLKFDAVFYRAKVWLNGQLVGEHEGGYTPFEIDISKGLQPENTLAVLVDNSWDTTTIPGAKTNVSFETQQSGQMYPWINYGGITRGVQLLTRPRLYADRLKIVATPDLAKGTASVRLTARLRNQTSQAASLSPAASIQFNGAVTAIRFNKLSVRVPAGADTTISLVGTLPAKDVHLWSHDQPNLYTVVLVSAPDTLRTRFGIRSLRVSGTSLLLNGEPIRMGGCNRPLDYPGLGSMDPDSVLRQDLALIKNGSMELSRISHYPVSEALLDWADEQGLLIIAEAGNWQMTPKQMSDPVMRDKFKSQLTEMVMRDWNHPSVVAWSMGNEFQSQTPEGREWVQEMRRYTRTIDVDRLITFASMIVKNDYIKKPSDEASEFVDFISVNIYSDHLKALRHIHEVYPDKPVYVSEFGLRTDGVASEAQRVEHLRKAMADFRQCDFLVGASVWTFNDYQSRFPGSNPNGYRPWGLVSPERTVRGMYTAWQEEFSPATMDVVERTGGGLTLKVTARAGFPSYTLRGYSLRSGSHSVKINTLKPGESQQLIIPSSTGQAIALVKPGGFIVYSKTF